MRWKIVLKERRRQKLSLKKGENVNGESMDLGNLLKFTFQMIVNAFI